MVATVSSAGKVAPAHGCRRISQSCITCKLPQPLQESAKGRALFLSDKTSQGLIKQVWLWHPQQGGGSVVGFLDRTVGVSDQVTVWGKIK
jgi:hypothetical protein